MAVGQIQNRCSKKYDYSQPSQLNRYYKANSGNQKLYSPQNTDACLPSTQTTSDDLSQDLLKEYTIKNQLLSQQVKEYRTLVSSLQCKINQLTEQNGQLKKIVDERTKQKVGYIRHLQKENALRKGLNLSLITQESQSQHMVDLKQIWDILNGYSQKQFNYQCIDKQFILNSLHDVVETIHSLTSFADGLWEMKNRTEPEGDSSLLGLWKWLSKTIMNYNDLASYQKRKKQRNSQIQRRKT